MPRKAHTLYSQTDHLTFLTMLSLGVLKKSNKIQLNVYKVKYCGNSIPILYYDLN